MNKAQKEVQQAQLDEEKKVIRLLQVVYERAKKDCEEKIRALSQRTDLENLQSIIYQKEYQQLLVDQLEVILYDLQEGEFTNIADYLEQSYVNGYTGVFYDMGKTSGIPLVIPIRQDQVVKAVQTDSKISSNLYSKLGEDVGYLKKSIRAELSRGISNGSSWNEMAVHIARGMNSPFKKAYNNAIRIARTEGHRIQNEAALDGQHGAKKKGADIVKQWDSTLDGRTRPEHREADGRIREIDEPFDIGGEKMQAPGVGGSARNVCNCRCCLLQRAKWALDDDELKTLQERAAFFGLDKTEDFNDFKQKYLKLPDNADTMNVKEPNSIDLCKTVEDVEKLLKNSGWYYEKVINGRVFKSADKLSLQGTDFECAKLVYGTQERLFKKYPELIGKLNAINVKRLSGSTYAQCMVGLGHGGVELNSQYFGNIEKLKKSFEKDVQQGFHPEGVGAGSIVTHEFGHALDDLLTNTYMACGKAGNSWKPKYVSAYLRPKVMKACGLKVSDIAREVSGYATYDAKEWFAECFCEWMESEDPRPVAKEFGKQLEALMKGVNWNAST